MLQLGLIRLGPNDLYHVLPITFALVQGPAVSTQKIPEHSIQIDGDEEAVRYLQPVSQNAMQSTDSLLESLDGSKLVGGRGAAIY